MNIVSVIIDWLHLLATVIWIGGMAFNIWVLRPSLTVIEPTKRVKLVGETLKRFIYFAWLSIALLIVTGVFLGRTTSGTLLSTNYGIILVTKHATVIAMAIIVAVISFLLFPKLKTFLSELKAETSKKEELSPELVKILGKTVSLVKLNLTLGILVLLFTAILGEV